MIVAAAAVGSAGVAAQEEQDQDLRRAVTELQRKNAELEDRVAELEMVAETADELGDETAEDLPGIVARYGDVQATFQIFGDVGFRFQNPEPPEQSHTLFDFGSIDFFLTAQLGDNFRVLSETVFDPESDGDISISQERLWGMWTFEDRLNAKLGTEHSPLSRWNQLYHHGRWLEPTLSRPMLAELEGGGGILPLHRTGLELSGSLQGGAGRLEYIGAVSNGRARNPTQRQQGADLTDMVGLEFDLAFVPASLPGLRIGTAFAFEEIPSDPMSTSIDRSLSMRELIGSAHVEVRAGDFDVLGEIAAVEHKSRATSQRFDHHSGYLQVIHRRGEWAPYTRFDYRTMEFGDPFYAPFDRDLDRWRQVIGVRWDVGTNVALKFEIGFGEEERREAGGVDEKGLVTGGIQLSWIL